MKYKDDRSKKDHTFCGWKAKRRELELSEAKNARVAGKMNSGGNAKSE